MSPYRFTNVRGVDVRTELVPAHDLALHVLSADTFGTARAIAEDFAAAFRVVHTGAEKRAYVEQLGGQRCVAIGNGANDAAMFAAAGLSVAVLGAEGAHGAALAAATLVCRSVVEALELLLTPQALTATLGP